MHLAPEKLESQRLYLRKPQKTDATTIFNNYARDPDTSRYLTWAPHRSINDTKRFLNETIKQWDKGKAFSWAIIRRNDQKLLGMIGIAELNVHGAMIGFVLDKTYWGMGYTTEAVKTLVDWAIGQESIFRVWAVCDTENGASARVLEKAGMQQEGILRRWVVLPNISDVPRDCFCYSVVKILVV